MTARTARVAQARPAGLRVIGGRRTARPQLGPFVVFGLVVVTSMFGIVMARTSLDAGAFELTDLNARIAAEEERQELLTLRVAELQSPTRIGPLAEEMGLVRAETRTVLLIEGINGETGTGDLVVDSGAVGRVAMGDQP
jgi:hypothetical protein